MKATGAPDAHCQPILVVLVWRGGDRFRRALESIGPSEQFFHRIILSITSENDSKDVQIAREYIAACALNGKPSKAEIICSGKELPTMQHQQFWIEYLENSGAAADSWIYWLAYDDQLRTSGLRAITDERMQWSLESGVSYFGPWAMRHEGPDQLWQGNESDLMESWTSLPIDQPTPLSTLDWIEYQLCNPTYIQMSGSVVSLDSHRSLVTNFPRKHGPMRIELATASFPGNHEVREFSTPISIIYGRSNSDRANYRGKTRREDLHLIALLAKRSARNPGEILRMLSLVREVSISIRRNRRVASPVSEAWIVRGYCQN